MHKSAFSLIELLIVIVIVGVVYTIAISNFKKVEDGTTKVTLSSLREVLHSFPHERSVELICLDNCSRCDVFIDAQKQAQNTLFDDFVDDSIVVYRYDFNVGVSEIKKKVYFNLQNVEEDICFSFSVDNKGVGDQVLVEYKDRVYDFTYYMDATPVYSSMQEAINAKEKLRQELLQ